MLSLSLVILVTVKGYKQKFFSETLDSEPTISILYARDKKSDKATNECITEMYPKNLYKYPLKIERNDVPCILHCVLKKFGIMTNDGFINLKNYYRRVQAIHRYDPRILISDVGDTCSQNVNAMNLDHDVCKKAKIFNDCTQLYAISLRELEE
uniref:Putative odorant binding protein 16 n=1 Tax=Corcyra cephalonica TaxID=139036 RepID=A0A8K1UB59_CORCP|nr:putative odorant binding protein 16 [Corcyra cephalonica]